MKRHKALRRNQKLRVLNDLQILDTENSDNFDIFTKMAISLLGMKTAVIGFLDGDRTWFKSALGMDAKEMPSSTSFCQAVVDHPEGLLVVEDIQTDARFMENSMVVNKTGLHFCAGAAFKAPDGTRLGAFCVASDAPGQVDAEFVDNLKRMADGVSMAVAMHAATIEAHRRSRTDALTGLNTLSVFVQEASEMVSKGPITMLMVDVQDMGALNNLFGRHVGDSVLCEVGRRIAVWGRSRKAICGRMGGDEFLLAIPGACSAKRVDTLARSLCACLTDYYVPNGLKEPVRLRTNVGAAVSTWNGTSIEEVVRAAEASLAMALRSGQSVGASHQKYPTTVAGKREASAMLKEAFRMNGPKPFRLDYQPIFNINDFTLNGFEALVRWESGDGRTWPPSCFIPVAEAEGIIADLDAWCLEKACEDAALWHGDLPVSVNISAASFLSGSIENRVRDALKRTGLSPARLKLEVTETVMLPGGQRTQEAMATLQAMGIRIMLDDFGCGHASFGYLRNHSFDGIKIDKAFVQGAEEGGKAKVLLRTLGELASLMGISTVAEGVETSEQLETVRSEGITVVQGYLLGRPGSAMAAAEMTMRFAARKALL